MVRSWNQLVGSAAELWAVLVSAPNSPSGSDPMERLRAVGEAIGRSVTSGHWPGHGPTDEHLTQIADNFSRARHLVERHGRPSELANPERNADSRHAQGQVMHTLYVTAHGTAVALGAYVANLQDRRGLINVADDVIATTNRAVAAVAQIDPRNLTRSIRSDPPTCRGHTFESLQINRPQKSSAKRTTPVTLPATARAGRGSRCWREPTARDSRTWARRCYASKAVTEILMHASGGIRPGRKGTRSWNRS